jgi:prepilin-type N-terminal cleavage/methylation domain-containing protein
MIHRNGMTLVELLVVLAILALLTTVAMTSTDVVLSQGRYDATTQTLTAIQEAVLGPPNARQSDGTLISSGFVADVGRPLLSTVGLSDLLGVEQPLQPPQPPPGIALFSLIQSPNDTDVVVPCGWRGPYLRLAPGQTSILDGWGNALVLVPNGNGQVVCVSSNGAATGPYSSTNAPLQVNIAPAQIIVSGNVYVLDSNGNPTNPTNAVQIWMYGPNPSTGLLLEYQCTQTTATDGVVSYNLPAGVYAPGFLRAYLGSRSTGTRRSAVVQFQRSNVINLNIQ